MQIISVITTLILCFLILGLYFFVILETIFSPYFRSHLIIYMLSRKRPFIVNAISHLLLLHILQSQHRTKFYGKRGGYNCR